MKKAMRIQLAGGIYYISNSCPNALRHMDSRASFEALLFQASDEFDWEIYAFLISSTEYTLVLKAHQNNLSKGLKWLQGTFGIRCNRDLHTQGFVFKSRYKAVLVEPGKHLNKLVDHVHIKALTVPEMTELFYRWSSLYYLGTQTELPKTLAFPPDRARKLKNSQTSPLYFWKEYVEQLDLKDGRFQELESILSQTWCYGSELFRGSLAQELINCNHIENRKVLKEQETFKAKLELNKKLHLLNKSAEDIQRDLFSSNWKLAIAYFIKQEFQVSHQWLTEQLNMGNARAVSNNLGVYERKKMQACRYAKKLANAATNLAL